MASHTTARLIRAGYGILTTEDGAPIFTALGPDAAANEAWLIAIWSSHDQIVAENVALREQLARKTVDLAELRGQIKDMQEAAYTYGDYSKEAVRMALDGVLDAIDKLATGAAGVAP